MLIDRLQSFMQRIKTSSVGQYVWLVALMLLLFWGFMAADGANVSFVYNNF